MAKLLAQHVIRAIHDCDRPGLLDAKKWASAIAPWQADGPKTKLVVLSYEVSETKGQCLRDYLSAGNTFAFLCALSKESNLVQPSESVDADESDLPEVPLPGGEVTIRECASQLGELLAENRTHYTLGGTEVSVGANSDDKPVLKTLEPARLASEY